MSRRTRSILIAVAALIVVIVVGAIFFIVPNMNDNDTSPTTDSPQTTQPAAPTDASGSDNNGQPGFGTPVVDILGRKVTVPNNPIGQPLPQTAPEPRIECTPTNTPITSPAGVQIQQTTAVPMLVSTTDGPASISGNILTEYSRSPQGAALAGWNWLAALYGPGPVAKDAYEQLTVQTPELEALTADERWDNPASSAAASLPAPVGFHVLSCTEDFASVEYAIEVPVDKNGRRRTTPVYSVLRAGLFYDGEQWKARMDSRSVSGNTEITDISSFTRWSFA